MHNVKPNTKYVIVTFKLGFCGSVRSLADATDGMNSLLFDYVNGGVFADYKFDLSPGALVKDFGFGFKMLVAAEVPDGYSDLCASAQLAALVGSMLVEPTDDEFLDKYQVTDSRIVFTGGETPDEGEVFYI